MSFSKNLIYWIIVDFSSIQFSRSVVSNSLWSYGLQHARPPCPSSTLGVYSNSCPSSQWCHPAISSSVVPFSSRLQSFPASGSFQMSQLFTSGNQSIGVSASTSVLPMNTQRLISFRMDWLDLLAVQGTLKSLLQHHSSKASTLLHLAFFRVQLSHPYMTTGKTIALTRWNFVGKVMSLLFNMLCRLVITFLPRSKCLLISWLQSPSVVILEPKKIKSATVSTVPPPICHEVMGPDAMILLFWMLCFKPTFSLSSFTFIKRLFSSSLLSAIRVVSSAYLRLLIFLPAILIPYCASSSLAFCMKYSAYKLNKQGDNMQPWCIPFLIWNRLTYNVDLQFVNFCCIAKWFSYTRNVISEQCSQYWIPWTIPKWVYVEFYPHVLENLRTQPQEGSTVLAPASHGAESLNIYATGFLVSPLRRLSSRIFLRRESSLASLV